MPRAAVLTQLVPAPVYAPSPHGQRGETNMVSGQCARASRRWYLSWLAGSLVVDEHAMGWSAARALAPTMVATSTGMPSPSTPIEVAERSSGPMVQFAPISVEVSRCQADAGIG